jgi:hypothetical protein
MSLWCLLYDVMCGIFVPFCYFNALFCVFICLESYVLKITNETQIIDSSGSFLNFCKYFSNHLYLNRFFFLADC